MSWLKATTLAALVAWLSRSWVTEQLLAVKVMAQSLALL